MPKIKHERLKRIKERVEEYLFTQVCAKFIHKDTKARTSVNKHRSNLSFLSFFCLLSLRAFVFSCLIVAYTHASLYAEIAPWGKDADLVTKPCHYTPPKPKSCKTPLVGAIGEAVITFHQTTITSCDGPRSNFRPSSSQYMLDAMRKYGFFQGFSMGCDRLMRENADPWVYRSTINEAGEIMKYDPVP
jgi:putative component of membrane protein insertase Oxa1/YidC/SpoIIIJ protein YidD